MFTIDNRSLSLYRVLISLVILFDLLDRLRSFHEHYTDYGLCPRSLVYRELWNFRWFSVYMIAGDTIGVFLIWCIHVAITICMLVGFRTTLCTFLQWVFVTSVQSRNIMVLHGGDTILRLLLFISIFLDLSKYYSVDSWIKKQRKGSYRYLETSGKVVQSSHTMLNAATIAFILQISLMYFVNYIEKDDELWRNTGDATFFALNIIYFRTFVGSLMLALPRVILSQLSFFVLYLEGIGPFLLFSPIASQWCRLIGVLLLMGMHVGFSLAMSLGTFGITCIAALSALLPPLFWDNLNYFVLRNFHNRISRMNRFLERNVKQIFALVSKPKNKSDDEKKRSRRGTNSRKIKMVKSAIKIIPLLGVIWGMFWCYSWRNQFERYPPMYDAGLIIRFDQVWTMFAPRPPMGFSYYVIILTTTTGERFELFKNQGIFNFENLIKEKTIDYSFPKTIRSDFHSHRWYKYFEQMYSHASYEILRDKFMTWICKRYDEFQLSRENNTTRAAHLIMYRMSQPIDAEGKFDQSKVMEVIGDRICPNIPQTENLVEVVSNTRFIEATNQRMLAETGLVKYIPIGNEPKNVL